jgi:hypothetical protein
MDDLEFRRGVLADPQLRDRDLVRAAQSDPARTRFVNEMRRFERRLEEALEVTVPEGLAERVLLRRSMDGQRSQAQQGAFERRLSDALDVDVPEGLAARILLRQGIAEQRRRQRIWRGGLALAASVLLSVTLTVFLWPKSVTLEESVLAHIHTEIKELAQRGPVSESQLRMVMHKNGAELVGEIGKVNFVKLCPMRKREGGHIILAGQMGPVTVFLMPEERISAPVEVADERFAGRIVPVANGSMAIVGERGEPVAEIEHRLRGALRFTS